MQQTYLSNSYQPADSEVDFLVRIILPNTTNLTKRGRSGSANLILGCFADNLSKTVGRHLGWLVRFAFSRKVCSEILEKV